MSTGIIGNTIQRNDNLGFADIFKNIVLAEPFTDDGRDYLTNLNAVVTKEDFFDSANGMFVEPFSEYLKERKDEDVSDPDYGEEIPYFEQVNKNELEKTNLEFITKVKQLNDFFYVVKGVAGCGKTTYIRYMENQFEDDVAFHIWDFQEVRRSIPFLETSIELKGIFDNNIYKFISVLISDISRCILNPCKDELDRKSYISEIVRLYNAFFNVNKANEYLSEANVDMEDQRNFFGLLKRYVDNKNSFEEMADMIKEYFLNHFYGKSDDGGKKDLIFIAGILARLYFCISRMDEKKHICAIDNIETFVKFDDKNPIQVCQLEAIFLGLKEASQTIKEYLFPIEKSGVNLSFFGIIIATRDTTASTALGQLEQEDYIERNEIDISNWFCTSDIIDKKIAFFDKRGIEIKSQSCMKAYRNILNDFSIYRWGLSGIVSKMYRHSHRRNVECLPNALSVLPISEVEHFNQMWELTQAQNDVHAQNLKSICRKYILRLLLNYVQRVKYFDRLMVESFSSPNPNEPRTIESYYKYNKNVTVLQEDSTSYARKIATLLHREYLNNRNTYVSFPVLILSILKPKYKPGQPDPRQIVNLGKILYLMNETRQSITNWTSLVLIRYDSSRKYNESELCKVLTEQWEYYQNGSVTLNDTNLFGVKLTEAGSLFAKILPEFEYFACRSLTDEPSLFSNNSFKAYVSANGERSFRGIEIIKIIRGRAFHCIDEVIRRDSKQFSNFASCQETQTPFGNGIYNCLYKETNVSREIYHPYRILLQHIGYIKQYSDYVNFYVGDDCFELKGADKAQFISLCEAEIQKYINKKRDMQNKYPNLFN